MFDKQINIHTFTGVAGLAIQAFHEKRYVEAQPDQEDRLISDKGSRRAMPSAFARLQYGLLGRYQLTLTGRADKFFSFPHNPADIYNGGVSAAWLISSEPFMQHQHWISNWKLRAGYGMSQYRSDPSTWLVGPLTEWNTGMDVGLWNSRVQFSTDVYTRTSTLVRSSFLYPFPGMISTPSTGEIRKKGLEFTLNTLNIDSYRFSWRTGLSLASSRNKIDLGNEPTITPVSGGTTHSPSPSTSSFLTSKPASLWYGTFTNTLTYRNFELAFMLQALLGKRPGLISRTTEENGTGNNGFPVRPVYITHEQVNSGSAFHARYITLRYNQVPSASSWMKNANIYLSGQNLFTLARYQPDKGVSTSPFDLNNFRKSIVLGIHVGL